MCIRDSSGSKDTTVKLFNVNDGTVLRTFTHHIGGVLCLALLPDGRRFVSGSGDHTGPHRLPRARAVIVFL